MVKADAYGHGAVAVGRVLKDCGCSGLGVATLAEAAELREALGEVRIVVFGGILPDEATRAVALGVEVAVYDPELVTALDAEALAAGAEVAVHIKVDTGMRRLGVEPADVAGFAELIANCRGLRPVALCSHFACAESVSDEVTRGQLETLKTARTVLGAGGTDLVCHLANSAAILSRPETHLDMVRPGLMLYGLFPDPGLAALADLRPVMTLLARIIRIADVGPDQGIGYGHSYRTGTRSRIATLRLGYADGYPRALSNLGEALVGGQRVAVVGRVSMDHLMVDITGLGGAAVGDEVTMWGAGLAVEEVAGRAETIPYELVARVGRRVQRLYREEGET